MKVSIYSKLDGKILRYVGCPADCVAIQCQIGEEFYLNSPPEATHIINNEPVTIIAPPTNNELLMQIRIKRNSRLAACDWTQMPDTPLSPEKRLAWATYRQQLRDFPDVCDVNNPVWPIPPN
jgi:hypothetical protein